MSVELETVTGDRRPVASGVRLGRPDKTFHRVMGGVMGGAMGVPIGLSIGITGGVHAWLLGLSGGICLTYLVGFTTFAMARTRRFANDNNLALAALGRGELAHAREVFARWTGSLVVSISALARHNLGWTLMLEGRLDEAATILVDAAEHHTRSLTRLSLLPTTRIDACLCYALLGKLELAETWLEKAQQPVKAAPRPAFEGMMAVACAVIDCRRGRAADASVDLEHAFGVYEATMTGETLRMMRVLRAFALAAADGVRNQGVVERVLGDMKPRYTGELSFLGRGWPEMATFLAAHALDG